MLSILVFELSFFGRNICVCVLTRVDVSAYEELLSRLKDIDLIRQIGSLLSWDQEVLMPPKAAPLRAEQLAWISKTGHERLTDERIGEILDERNPKERDVGTLAISCLCSQFNIDIVRVHNVKLNYQILKVADRIYRK